MAEQQGSSLADVLVAGINAYTDSQNASAYAQNQQQAYNTASGVGGQSQFGGLAGVSPVVLIGGVLVLGLVLFLALRR